MIWANATRFGKNFIAPAKFFWACTPMVIYYAFCYLLNFNLLILPEERMNFKLNNIPGNSVYIEIDKMNDDILAQIV